ncbi:hypothetical protein Tco_0874901, partial [Tanacetum coccineum]
SLYNIGPAGGRLTFQKTTDPFDEALCASLARHPFEAQTFPDPILYLAGLASSWEYAPSVPLIFIDEEEASFINFMKRPGQNPTFSMRPAGQPIDVGSPFMDYLKSIYDNDQGEISSVSKSRYVTGLELAVVGDSPSKKGAGSADGSKKRCSIDVAFDEGATVIKLIVAGNSSKHEAKRWEQEGLRRISSWGSIPPLPTSAPKGVGKHSRVLARHLESSEASHDPFILDVQEAYSAHNVLSGLHCPSLKNKPHSLSLDDLANIYDVHALHLAVVGNMLTNKSRIVSRDYSKLKDDFISLRSKNGFLEHEMSKLEEVSDELDMLRPSVEEVEHLSKRFQDSKALNEVHGLGSSWDFKDVDDYNPDSEKIFNEAAEAFYKLEFPYISLLVEKVGQSPGLLAAVDPPTIQEVVPL